MRKLATLTVFFGLLCGFGAGGASAQDHEHSAAPPQNLKKVGDHWTAWDPPASGPEHYVIQKGDTLWDLAGKWFDDPFLWPQIWDENRYILDSHWIYPGDPLVVPGRPTVVPEGEIPPSAMGEGEGEGEGGAEGGQGEMAGEGQALVEVEPERELPSTPPAPLLVPAADPSDLYCSGYIEQIGESPSLRIAGRDIEGYALGEGHVVYLNRGRNAGVRAGDQFTIVRLTDQVAHPSTRQKLGTYVRRLGKVRVLIAHEDSATASIDMSCEDIYVGDRLVPWEEIPVPMLSATPRFDRLDPTPSGGPAGHVVWQRDNLSAFGAGHVIYTDLGRIAGVMPGDFIRLYRLPEQDMPRRMIGQAVILTVGADTSAAKITYSVIEGEVGDRVELLK